MHFHAATAACLLAATGAIVAPATVHAEETGPSRATIARDYQTVLLPALSVPNDWVGSLTGCDAGSTSSTYEAATLTAVNYFRNLADLPPVSFNPEMNAKARAAAVMMAAQGALEHRPPSSWKCWSQAGYDGASHSNLALNFAGAAAVMGYMADPGQTNDAVGHRRWILNSEADQMGTGSTATSNALYVVGGPVRTISPRWVPWPSQGYFPWQLEPAGRWSLSLHGASFESAHVSASIAGAPLSIVPAPIKGSVADNTISWQVALPARSSPTNPADLTVDVTVDGVHLADGSDGTYSYSVTLFDASTAVSGTSPPSGHTVPAAPKGVAARRNAGGIGVQWQTASDPTGEVLRYIVTATPFGTGSRGVRARACRSSTTSCEVTRTLRRVAYRIRVVAYNSYGASLATAVTSPATRR